MSKAMANGVPARADKIMKVSPEDYSLESKDYTALKVICLGDSAVGKSKMIERFLIGQFYSNQVQQSTYALNLYRYETKLKSKKVIVDFWDTAGQEQFNTMHPSYYHQAHACVLVFDITRKVTYKNLPHWYKEMRQYRPNIPCILVANKIDVDYRVTERNFRFAKDNQLPLYFVSASDGTNVVRIFKETIKAALVYKESSADFMDLIMKELEEMDQPASQSKGAPPLTSGEMKSDITTPVRTRPIVPLATPITPLEGNPLAACMHEGPPITQNSH